MQAICQHQFGGPDTLVVADLADLVPAPGELRIAVEAAGVHLLDTVLREGQPGPFGVATLPTIPGREVAGTVDAVGDGVDDEWIGRRATVHLGAAGGGYAAQVVAPAAAAIPIAAEVDAAEAVALVGTGRTAVAILAEAAIGTGDAVVVPAAAGGLGVLLVQAAKRAGAWVGGAAGGAEKVAIVRRLGADVAVDYLRPGWVDELRAALGERPLTVVLDGVGGEIGRQAFELIAPGGRMVLFGYTSGAPTAISATDLFDRGVAVTAAIGARMLARPGGIRDLAVEAVRRLGAGEWRPLVTRFPLAEAPAAHRAFVGRDTIGKVVLIP